MLRIATELSQARQDTVAFTGRGLNLDPDFENAERVAFNDDSFYERGMNNGHVDDRIDTNYRFELRVQSIVPKIALTHLLHAGPFLGGVEEARKRTP